MKVLILIASFLIPINFCTSLRADVVDEKPLSPTDALTEAKQGPLEFIHTVNDLIRATPQLPTSQELFPYILILDELEKIGKEFKIESYGGNPVADLSVVLTRNAAKWLRLDSDDWGFLNSYFKWSESGTLYTVAQNQIRYITLLQTKNELLRWNDAIGKTILAIDKLKKESYVIPAFADLQANLLRRILSLEDLTKDETLLIIRATTTSSGLQAISDYFQQLIVKTKEGASLQSMVEILLTFSTAVRSSTTELPYYLQTSPGSLLVGLISKLLSKELSPPAEKASEIVEALCPSQLLELGTQLTALYSERTIPQEVVPFLWNAIQILLKKYSLLGETEKLRVISKLAQKLDILRAFERTEFEGTYEIQIKNETLLGTLPPLSEIGISRFSPEAEAAGTMTIVNIGASNFIVGIRQDRYLASGTLVSNEYSLFHATYNLRDNTYEAHHYAVDSADYIPPVQRNFYLKFDIARSDRGEINLQGRFSNGLDFFKIKGKKTEVYPYYEKIPEGESVENVTGTYEGKTPNGKEFLVNITQVGFRTSGNLHWEDRTVTIPLSFGYYNANRNVVYATSGELTGGKWVQLRGQLSQQGKKLNSTIIIGGAGIKIEGVSLERVD